MGLSYPVGVAVFGSTNSLVKRDRTEVSTLSGGVCCNPYPSHYRTAFAFSVFLYPQTHGLSLRSACPCGRDFGLTLFHSKNVSGVDLA